jgi:hypothetical protein
VATELVALGADNAVLLVVDPTFSDNEVATEKT